MVFTGVLDKLCYIIKVSKKKGGNVMKNSKKVIRGLLLGLCLLAMTGCEIKSTDNSLTTNNVNNSNNVKGNSLDQLIANATLEGGVVDFTNKGCTVSPSKTEDADGGEIAYQAAPGMDNNEDNIKITYQEGCVFQLAVINPTTGKLKISNISKDDIKKQSQIIIYGDYQNASQISASKIVITRYEEVAK